MEDIEILLLGMWSCSHLCITGILTQLYHCFKRKQGQWTWSHGINV